MSQMSAPSCTAKVPLLWESSHQSSCRWLIIRQSTSLRVHLWICGHGPVMTLLFVKHIFIGWSYSGSYLVKSNLNRNLNVLVLHARFPTSQIWSILLDSTVMVARWRKYSRASGLALFESMQGLQARYAIFKAGPLYGSLIYIQVHAGGVQPEDETLWSLQVREVLLTGMPVTALARAPQRMQVDQFYLAHWRKEAAQNHVWLHVSCTLCAVAASTSPTGTQQAAHATKYHYCNLKNDCSDFWIKNAYTEIQNATSSFYMWYKDLLFVISCIFWVSGLIRTSKEFVCCDALWKFHGFLVFLGIVGFLLELVCMLW